MNRTFFHALGRQSTIADSMSQLPQAIYLPPKRWRKAGTQTKRKKLHRHNVLLYVETKLVVYLSVRIRSVSHCHISPWLWYMMRLTYFQHIFFELGCSIWLLREHFQSFQKLKYQSRLAHYKSSEDAELQSKSK